MKKNCLKLGVQNAELVVRGSTSGRSNTENFATRQNLSELPMLTSLADRLLSGLEGDCGCMWVYVSVFECMRVHVRVHEGV